MRSLEHYSFDNLGQYKYIFSSVMEIAVYHQIRKHIYKYKVLQYCLSGFRPERTSKLFDRPVSDGKIRIILNVDIVGLLEDVRYLCQ